MTSFFPDLNVWLALSVSAHRHSREASLWLATVPPETRLIFSRYTNLGLLRLLTSDAVMGEQTQTLKKAWLVYDRWLKDPRVEFNPEPRGVEHALREIASLVEGKAASKALGDCYLLAFAKQSQAVLVTFDRALHAMARKRGYASLMPE